MGYDPHITRAENWFDGDDAPITLDEWLSYIESDPEMRLDGHAEANFNGGAVLRYENDGLAVWTAYSQLPDDDCGAWFDFRGGNVVVKNPDDELIAKMKQIAVHFSARVVGDEGEEY